MKNEVLSIHYRECKVEELPPHLCELVQKAKEACETSYAPYSKFHVGAALLLDNGETVTGSNQENASFPAGTCAERCAVFYANARWPEAAVTHIAIAAIDSTGQFTENPITPCGICRQVLSETQKRGGRNLHVLLYGRNGVRIIENIDDLLPFSFDLDAE